MPAKRPQFANLHLHLKKVHLKGPLILPDIAGSDSRPKLFSAFLTGDT
jgi:hypothetical protein